MKIGDAMQFGLWPLIHKLDPNLLIQTSENEPTEQEIIAVRVYAAKRQARRDFILRLRRFVAGTS
ncbi:MAG: hypothetical protein VX444_15145 [Pseudomonadota bacterium]|nr:hypothetical protein [Pseudomonadota bacterium]